VLFFVGLISVMVVNVILVWWWWWLKWLLF